MDPMESMSTGPVPKDFNAEEAENMEEVSWFHPVDTKRWANSACLRPD